MSITKRDNLGRIVRINSVVIQKCNCGVKFQTDEGRIKDGRGLYCSKSCFFKFRRIKREQEHHMWKSRPSYSGIHKWIQARLGSPMICYNCGFKTDNKYQVQWANISGDYLRDISDWIRLCAKCHWHYDRENLEVEFNYA